MRVELLAEETVEQVASLKGTKGIGSRGEEGAFGRDYYHKKPSVHGERSTILCNTLALYCASCYCTAQSRRTHESATSAAVIAVGTSLRTSMSSRIHLAGRTNLAAAHSIQIESSCWVGEVSHATGWSKAEDELGVHMPIGFRPCVPHMEMLRLSSADISGFLLSKPLRGALSTSQ